MAECRVDLYRLNITFPPPGEPLPCFRVRTNGHHITSLQEIEEEQEDNILAWERDSASPCSLNSEESGINCEVCNTAGGRLICQECGRGYHGPCHVPPITTLHQLSSWTCSICQDLTDSTDPFRKERHKKPMMSTVDQRKCEHLVLTLMCKSWSDVLYTSGKDVPSDVDFECIHMRLLRKMSPPYRTPSELVSDVWVLLESLLDTSEDAENVQRIHRFFKKKVQRVFGNCIHPSVLVGPRGYQDKDNRQIEEDTLTEEWDSSDDYVAITAKKRRRK